MSEQCPEQETWYCSMDGCDVEVVAVDATRIFCPECGSDMGQREDAKEESHD